MTAERTATLRRAALCVASGALLFLSCADFDIWPLAWLGMVPLLVVILDEDCAHPAFWGWVTGLVANGGGFYWINHLLMRFGHMPFVAAAPLYLLLIGYQAVTFALFAWALRRLRDRLSLPVALLAPVIMTGLELVVPFLFPWYLAITQAWVRPVIQIADLTGPLGVTFLLGLSNGALYEIHLAWRKKLPIPWRHAAAAATVIAASLVYGQIRIHQVESRRAAAPKVKVGVVQANIGITEKWVPGLFERHLAVHQALSADLERAGAELIVWPESSYPYYFQRDQTRDHQNAWRVQRGFSTPILFGTLTRGAGKHPYNSALMMDRDGSITGRFDKNFLLVFGEYLPLYNRVGPWVEKLVPEVSNFARGDGVTTFPFRQWKLGPMICYEDILPEFGRRLVAQRPNLLINVTNDAWFGATSEPWEHFALSVYRAVEHRLDLVRAVNTGVSAFVDATGRVVRTSPAVDPVATPGVKPVTLLEEAAMLDASGPYGTLGDLFGALNLVALLGLGAWARQRGGHPVAWRPVAAGVALGALLIALGALLAGGPSEFAVALDLFAHRPTTGDRFLLGIELGAAALLAFVVVGVVLAERRLEATIAVVALVLGPPLLVGRLEGETASLVFSALFAAGAVRLGSRLGARFGARPPVAAQRRRKR